MKLKQRLRNLVNITKIIIIIKPIRFLLRSRRTEMLDYPKTVDFECVTTMLSIVKNREVMDRKQEFCKCGWNVAGYLLYISIGDVPGDYRGVIYAHSGTLQDSLEDMEAELDSYLSTLGLPGAPNPEDEPGDLATVLLIVSTVINLLRALGFVKNRRNKDEEEDI